MRTSSSKLKEGFVELQIHIDALQKLLTRKALYVEDIHCSDSTSKHLLQQLVMMSVMPEGQA